MRSSALAWRRTLCAIIASRETLVRFYAALVPPDAPGHRADAIDQLAAAQAHLDADRAALAAWDAEHTSRVP